MAIRFRPLDFLQPVSLWGYRSIFQHAQWWPPERLRAYQRERLRAVLRHAAAAVPYYRQAFDRAGLRPDDIRGIEDLGSLPLLTQADVRLRAADLTAADSRRFRPARVSTSGSTGPPVTVLLDRRTNAMEFAFYWRHWGWFGYRLGDRFAQLSWAEFSGARTSAPAYAQIGTGRLLLNALCLSQARAVQFASAMRAHRARFLKGHASALLHFSLFVRSGRIDVPPLRAVFSTGEVLEPAMRAVIHDVFQAPVADAYGHMERVVAACECPHGRMHINPDYGCWEVVGDVDPGSGRRLGRIVGSSLHNLSMPLVRYDTGDLVELDDTPVPCPCGRSFPTVGRVHGRSVDAIVTPDGRVVTVASIVFRNATGVLQGQLVQEELDRLQVRVLAAPEYGAADERGLVDEVRRLVGPSMKIDIERISQPEAFVPSGVKHRPVVSTVYQRSVAQGTPLP